MSNLYTAKRLLTFTNFDHGINTTKSVDELDPTELISAVNIDIKARGGYSQRKGCSVHKAFLADSVPLAYPVSKLINYPSKPLLVINKSLRDWDNNTITLLLNSNNISYEFFTNSKLYLLDGTKYWIYNGTTLVEVTATSGTADLTPIKRCTTLLQRGQRMFALGDPQNPNYLYFSDVGDPTSFQPSSVVKAVTDDNDSLTGMTTFADYLLAFKGHSIFKWSGWDPSSDVEFKNMDTGHGSINQSVIQVADNYLIYADDEGVFCLATVETDVIKSYNISKPIEDIYSTLTNKVNMRAIVYQGNYYLACCNDGTGVNNLVLKASIGMAYNGSSDEGVDSLLFPWVEYTGWNVSDWMTIDGILYFSSSKDGVIYKAFDGLNDQVYNSGVLSTNPISSEAYHYLKIEDTVVSKKLKSLFLIAQQLENSSCTIRLDIEANYTAYSKMISLVESGSWDASDWDEVVWDWVDTITKEIKLNKKTSRVKVKITHNLLDEAMVIYGFAAYYKTKKPRGSRDGITNITSV